MNTSPVPRRCCPQRDGSIGTPLSPEDVLRRLRLARTLLSGVVYRFRHDSADRNLRSVAQGSHALLALADDPARHELLELYRTVELARSALSAPQPDYLGVVRLITTAMEFASRWEERR